MSEISISNNPKPPKRGERVMAKDIAELWQAVKRLAAQQDTIRPLVFPAPRLAPLTVTLRRIAASPVTWEVFAEYGHVVPRHNESAATGAPIAITSIPTEAAPLAVVLNTKLWVRVTIDAYGKATAATWQSNTTWPTDTPPDLIGGNDQTGASGYRYIRIAEIIANPGSTTTPAQLKCEQLHTGHVDHFQPELSENTSNSISGDQARVLKEWNTSAGRWDFRFLNAGDGVDITEGTDSITVAATATSHPFKVTNGGSGNATIAAGFMQGYYLSYAAYDPNVEPAADGIKVPESIVAGFSASYAGGNLAITGTKYIYAEIPRNGPTVEYSESKEEGDVTVFAELYDDIEPSPGDTITMVAHSDGPETYTSTAGKAARCIAKVTNAAGVITVDAQYVHNNPDMFLPVINVGGNLAIA